MLTTLLLSAAGSLVKVLLGSAIYALITAGIMVWWLTAYHDHIAYALAIAIIAALEDNEDNSVRLHMKLVRTESDEEKDGVEDVQPGFHGSADTKDGVDTCPNCRKHTLDKRAHAGLKYTTVSATCQCGYRTRYAVPKEGVDNV